MGKVTEEDMLNIVRRAVEADERNSLGKVHSFRQRDEDTAEGVTLENFHAYMPQHSYIFAPTREMWPAASVNARIPPVSITESGKEKTISAAAWLDRHSPVEQMTWAPGKPMIIADRLVSDGGWIERNGVACFNLYRPPTIQHGDPNQANLWLNLVEQIFPNDFCHIIAWLAHRVQHPEDKVNHALVLGGAMGIGKDTIVEPVKHAIGPWNFHEVSPQQMLGRFNGFLKSIILRINEARDLGDINRFAFYDHMKAYTAAPPDVLRCDEKHLREHSVLNVCGVIITTNHKADGIYLPADDRRHYVAWSEHVKEDFTREFWDRIWSWYARGGMCHVAAYLARHDLTDFNPKAPPPKTQAFLEIVDANRAPEDAELADIFDRLGSPDATTLIRITSEARGDFETWIKDRKNQRAIPHRLESAGYVPVLNETAKSGLWVINGKRQRIYAKAALAPRDRFKAASALMASSNYAPEEDER
jgi:hypothetical protein